jgi:hypothetical protein
MRVPHRVKDSSGGYPSFVRKNREWNTLERKRSDNSIRRQRTPYPKFISGIREKLQTKRPITEQQWSMTTHLYLTVPA